MMEIKKIVGFVVLASAFANAPAQMPLSWEQVGVLKTKDAREIKASTWSIGGETLDRAYADYQSYKTYLGPLGQSASVCKAAGRDAKR